MFGLDDWVAHFSDGTTVVLVIVVAVVLGLRHATDPDHLAAVTTLIAGGRDRAARTAARLGAAWGLGHATSLFAFGLPIVLYRAYLPAPVQTAVETTVGLLIIALALWVLVRWHHGHTHGDRPRRARSARQAFGIGLVHGMGGSAGVGVLLLATIHDRTLAVAALALFAVCTATSMAALTAGWGLTLTRPAVQRSFDRLVPALGVASLGFGAWYALGALSVAPYYF
jgi:ABC-type nickel/cobalt efflux system permease component RcnA